MHADWSTHPRKRWAAVARRRGDGWVVGAPHRVDLDTGVLAGLTGSAARSQGTTVLGVDAVIGLPRAYAGRAGVTRFLDVLPALGRGRWARFFDVAESAQEISPRRPFYPQRPGGTSKADLTRALGLEPDQLLRRCEHPTADRPGGAELFWTLGGKQVGKAAISLWRDVLQPLLAGDLDVRVWPFDGAFAELVGTGPDVVVAEAYPAEARLQIGLGRRAGSKRDQRVRAADAPGLLAWAAAAGVELTRELHEQIAGGFGGAATGEDAADAVVGLFGMLDVVLGARPAGAPTDDPDVVATEGWILGLDPAAVAGPADGR